MRMENCVHVFSALLLSFSITLHVLCPRELSFFCTWQVKRWWLWLYYLLFCWFVLFDLRNRDKVMWDSHVIKHCEHASNSNFSNFCQLRQKFRTSNQSRRFDFFFLSQLHLHLRGLKKLELSHKEAGSLKVRFVRPDWTVNVPAVNLICWHIPSTKAHTIYLLTSFGDCWKFAAVAVWYWKQQESASLSDTFSWIDVNDAFPPPHVRSWLLLQVIT